MDRELINKYFRNECSEDEVKQVLKLLNDPTKEQSILSSIELNWYKYEVEEFEKQKSIVELKRKVIERINTSSHVHLKNADIKHSPRRFLRTFWKSAAVITFIFVIIYFLKNNIRDNSEATFISTSSNFIINNCPKGKKIRVTLADGTKVSLNSESKISYSADNFGVFSRTVYLEGEAYFQVARNDSVPFTVSTRALTVKALGTSFNVRTYPEEDFYVALESGKVLVTQIDDSVTNKKSLLLNPGDIVSFSKTHKNMEFANHSIDQHLGWNEGNLYFNESSLSEVVKKLERWYGVDIVILNQYGGKDWRYSGKYKNESLENVLLGIGYTKLFDFEIINNIVYIKFKTQ